MREERHLQLRVWPRPQRLQRQLHRPHVELHAGRAAAAHAAPRELLRAPLRVPPPLRPGRRRERRVSDSAVQ